MARSNEKEPLKASIISKDTLANKKVNDDNPGTEKKLKASSQPEKPADVCVLFFFFCHRYCLFVKVYEF